MKKLTIIATAIALALPAIAVGAPPEKSLDAPVAPSAGQMPPGLNHQSITRSQFSGWEWLESALQIKASQQKAFAKYTAAEDVAFAWDAPYIGTKQAYINAAKHAASELIKTNLTNEQTVAIFGREFPSRPIAEDISLLTINWVANEAKLDEKQKALYLQYAQAGEMIGRINELTDDRVYQARADLAKQLTTEQLRRAVTDGLIDNRRAPRIEMIDIYSEARK